MRNKKWWWWAVVLVIAVIAIWSWRRRGESQAERRRDDPSLLRDRAWVDSKPATYTDYVHGFIALSYLPVGFFTKASSYDAHIERFDFTVKGNKIHVTFPQSGREADITFTVRACRELQPFDLCLDLSENPWGGPRRYYGLRNPKQEERTLGAFRRRMLAELPQ